MYVYRTYNNGYRWQILPSPEAWPNIGTCISQSISSSQVHVYQYNQWQIQGFSWGLPETTTPEKFFRRYFAPIYQWNPTWHHGNAPGWVRGLDKPLTITDWCSSFNFLLPVLHNTFMHWFTIVIFLRKTSHLKMEFIQN